MLPEKENCTQDFLNAGQYKRNGILRYERVFGHTFVSTGGLTTTKVKKLISKSQFKTLCLIILACCFRNSGMFVRIRQSFVFSPRKILMTSRLLTSINFFCQKKQMNTEFFNLVEIYAIIFEIVRI